MNYLNVSTYTNVNLIKDTQNHIAKPLELVFPLLGPSNTDMFLPLSLLLSSNRNYRFGDNHINSSSNEQRQLDGLDQMNQLGQNELNTPLESIEENTFLNNENSMDINAMGTKDLENNQESNEKRFSSSKKLNSILTNDGATFLIELSNLFGNTLDGIVLLKELSCCMDQVGGDGTTGVVCLVRQLLKTLKIKDSGFSNLGPIFKRNDIRDSIMNILSSNSNFNPNINPTGNENVVLELRDESILDHVLDMSTVRGWDRKTCQYALVKTTLSSKISSYIMPTMIDLSIDAIEATKGKYEDTPILGRKNIEILKQIGSISQSTLVPNAVILKVEKETQLYSSSPYTAIIVRCSLNLPKSILNYANTVEEADRIIREENIYITKIIASLRKNKINLLLLQEDHRESLSQILLRQLKKFNIQIIIAKKQELDFLQYSMNNTCKYSNDNLKADYDNTPILINSITSIRQLFSLSQNNLSKFYFLVDSLQKVNGESMDYIIIQSKSFKENVCIMLYSSSKTAVDEMERAFHDSLKVLEIFYKDPRLVYGGGCTEMIMNSYLQYGNYINICKKFNPNISVIMKAIGEAFEIIPMILSQNCGLNPGQFVNQLKKFHIQNKYHCGLFINDSGEAFFQDFTQCTSNPPVELLHNKKAQISMVLETTWQLIKIDEIYKWKI